MAKVIIANPLVGKDKTQVRRGKLNESKIPDFRFIPPPPLPQKKSEDLACKKE